MIKKKIKRSLSDGGSFIEQSSRQILSTLSSAPVENGLENGLEEKQNNLALEFYLLNRIKNRVKFLSTSHQRQGLTIGLEDLFVCDEELKNLDAEETEGVDDPWRQKGFEQSLSQCRKELKQSPEKLNVCVTRIALPIETILERIINKT